MREYTPDTWVMLKFVVRGETIYKILAGWYGGYATGDSWKLNSGCVKIEQDENHYLFYGSSGSVYRCHKKSYGMSGYTSQVYRSFCQDVDGADDITMEALDADVNFMELEYK
jgi:hypothetical protein